MIAFVILLALPPLLFLYFQSHKSKNVDPPGPPALPFIGNLHQFDAKSPHTYLHRLSKQYGSIFTLKLGFRKAVVVSSADVVKEIMKSHDVEFAGRPSLVSTQKLSYNGMDVVFAQYNEIWRQMRKLCAIHLFTTKQLQYFHPICKDEVSNMIHNISQDASHSKVTNLSEAIVSFTNNSICRMAFGKSFGGEDYGNSHIFNLFCETQYVAGAVFVEDFLPCLKWIDYLTGMRTKLENCFKVFDSLCEQLISEHLNPNRPKSMEGDILDTLLNLKRNGSSSSFDLTMDNIKAVTQNIIIGGTDTTAIVLVWALTALINKPATLKKVQTEIRDLAGTKNNYFIDEEDTAKLPYLRAVLKETLRLYPPFPLITRLTTKKCSLNGYDVEGGTIAFFNAWAIARDPTTWENPNEFSPERFLESDIDVRGLDPEVIPFGFGRRRCPGIAIGTSEIEMALANLLCRFDWELPAGVTGVDFETSPGLTMHKKNALLLVPKLVFI